jgi:hypothetical protein
MIRLKKGEISNTHTLVGFRFDGPTDTTQGHGSTQQKQQGAGINSLD